MAGESKRERRGYLRDFEKKADGGYVYTGPTWRAENAARRRLLIRLWVLQAVMLSAALLPGFVTTAGLLNSFYVILPYVLWALSDIYLAYMLGNMTFGGNPLRDYVYKSSVARYTPWAMAALVGAALTAAGMLVFLIRGGSGEGVALCFVCSAVQIVSSVLINRCRVADIWDKEKMPERENG
ncbi:MAG: hypothetical protein NC434_05475 [Ruminococcus sp.]|nr:hypothetical protein [Ruminococcus sp.]